MQVLNKFIIKWKNASSPHLPSAPHHPLTLSYFEEIAGLWPLERNLYDTERLEDVSFAERCLQVPGRWNVVSKRLQ